MHRIGLVAAILASLVAFGSPSAGASEQCFRAYLKGRATTFCVVAKDRTPLDRIKEEFKQRISQIEREDPTAEFREIFAQVCNRSDPKRPCRAG